MYCICVYTYTHIRIVAHTSMFNSSMSLVYNTAPAGLNFKLTHHCMT